MTNELGNEDEVSLFIDSVYDFALLVDDLLELLDIGDDKKVIEALKAWRAGDEIGQGHDGIDMELYTTLCDVDVELDDLFSEMECDCEDCDGNCE